MFAHEGFKIRLLQGGRPVKDVDEFADVTWIFVIHQRGNLLFFENGVVAKLAPPCVCDDWNVIFVFTQGRRSHLHHIEALVEVFAELTFDHEAR